MSCPSRWSYAEGPAPLRGEARLPEQRLSAAVTPDGNKGREFGIGPQIRYDLPFGGFAFELQRAFGGAQPADVGRIWFQFAVPLTDITKRQ